jgi:hypothetical protein
MKFFSPRGEERKERGRRERLMYLVGDSNLK